MADAAQTWWGDMSFFDPSDGRVKTISPGETSEHKSVTNVRVLARTKQEPIFLCKDNSAVGNLMAETRPRLNRGGETQITIIKPGDTRLQTVTVKAAEDFAWYQAPVRWIAIVFFIEGGAALGGGVIAAIIGFPVSLWVFPASLLIFTLGLVFHLLERRLV
jgi:hypothetical protein